MALPTTDSKSCLAKQGKVFFWYLEIQYIQDSVWKYKFDQTMAIWNGQLIGGNVKPFSKNRRVLQPYLETDGKRGSWKVPDQKYNTNVLNLWKDPKKRKEHEKAY